jgi:hypothetical protein
LTVDKSSKRFQCYGVDLCPFRSRSSEDRDIIGHMMKRHRETHPGATAFPFTGRDFLVLEIRGLDGMIYSNSYFFENFLGWRAVLFEPSRDQYSQLYASSRPIFTHSAL